MAFFTHNEINELARVMLQVGIADDRSRIRALKQGIAREFISNAPSADNPGTELRLLLHYVNGVERLKDGTVPIEILLSNAVAEVQALPEADVLQAALERLRGGGSVTGSATFAHDLEHVRTVLKKVEDAGGLEHIVGRDDMLSFAFLSAGFEVGRAVVKLKVPRYENGVPVKDSAGKPVIFSGTGWLLAGDLVITNHHVIDARYNYEPRASEDDLKLQGAETAAIFDFDGDAAGQEGKEVPASALVAWSAEIDYAVLRLSASPGRKPLRVTTRAPDLRRDPWQAMNIVQHPNGTSKKIALRNNLLVEVTADEMVYLTDTEQGSSGSPVCNDAWQVIALHRNGKRRVRNLSVEGKRVSYVNVGVPMMRVMEDLAARYADVAQQVSV